MRHFFLSFLLQGMAAASLCLGGAVLAQPALRPPTPPQQASTPMSAWTTEALNARLLHIQTSRLDMAQALEVQRAQCYQRFAVNSCIAASRQAQYPARVALFEEEVALEDEQRRRTVELRAIEIARKSAQHAQDALQAPLRQGQAEQAMQQTQEASTSRRQTLDQKASQRLQRQQEKLQQANERMAEYERRLKARQAKGEPKAPSLPQPPGM